MDPDDWVAEGAADAAVGDTAPQLSAARGWRPVKGEEASGLCVRVMGDIAPKSAPDRDVTNAAKQQAHSTVPWRKERSGLASPAAAEDAALRGVRIPASAAVAAAAAAAAAAAGNEEPEPRLELREGTVDADCCLCCRG